MIVLRSFFLLIAVVPVYLSSAFGQSLSDTLYLGDILIEAAGVKEIRQHQPVQVQTIDSLRLSLSGPSTLAGALESHSGLFIRNYGPGGSSTVSQRGLPASQTQIFWKGFNLNHPMLGLTDLSTLPTHMISGIEISPAGGSAYGSGTLGGSIRLNSGEAYSGLEISQSAGTYRSFFTGNDEARPPVTDRTVTSVRAGATGENWDFSLSALTDHSENAFVYRDRVRFPAEYRLRENNHIRTRGLISHASRTTGSLRGATGFWYGGSERGVPGPMQSPTKAAFQEDEFFRWFGEVQRSGGKLNTGMRGYINRQQLNFFNPGAGIESMSTHTSGIMEVPAGYSVSDAVQINSLVTLGHTIVESNVYDFSQKRTQFSGQLNPLIMPLESLRVYPSVRLDRYSDFGTALTYALGLNYALIRNRLHWRLYAGTDFSAPTFNDLYWPGLGDPDLRPEEGWKAETGFYGSVLGDHTVHRIEAQFFISRLRDGIQWLPGEGGLYRPQNIRQINVQGFELQTSTAYLGDRFQWNLGQIFTGTWSTYGKPRFPGDQATGNQLVYTPRWQYRLSASVQWGSWSGSATWGYTGARYVTEDNHDAVDPYSFMDLAASRSFRFLGATSHVQWNVNNLFNADYEVIRYYPIPGRHHLVTLKIRV